MFLNFQDCTITVREPREKRAPFFLGGIVPHYGILAGVKVRRLRDGDFIVRIVRKKEFRP